MPTLTIDDLEWCEPPAPTNPVGRVKAFVRLLSERPGEWAKYPHPYSRASVRYMVNKYPKRYAGTEWCSRKIDGEAVLFARWIGDS